MEINTLLKATVPVNIASSGRRMRQYDRGRRINRVEEKTIKLMLRYLPCLSYLPALPDQYTNQLGQTLTELKAAFSSVDEQAISRQFLARYIETGNRKSLWSLKPPETLTKLRRSRQLRTLSWHNYARSAATLATEFEDALNNPNLFEKLTPDQLLSLAAFSAAYYGALCNAGSLVSLANILQEKHPVQQGVLAGEQLLWIDLYPKEASIHNIRIDDSPARLKRWFIDPVTLGLIHRYLQASKLDNTVIYHQGNLYNNIRSTLKTLGISLPFKTLAALCRYGIAVTECLPGAALSSAIVETALERTLSVCLPNEVWRSLFITKPKALPTISFSDYEHWQNTIDFDFPAKKSRGNKFISAIERSLKTALAIKDKDGHKQTPAAALKKLHALDTSDFNAAGECLWAWYVSLLNKTKLKVKSVYRYHTEVAKIWLMADEQSPLNEMDADSLVDRYKTLINAKMTTNGRNYRAQRLETLHTFAVMHFGFPMLPEPLATEHKSTPFVRAGYITKTLFDSTLYNISRIDDLDSNSKLCIQAIVVVAYRTGLRLQEIIKLQLSDIEYSGQLWLFTRNNLYDDNKSDGSLRKIPLSALLTESEHLLFTRYLSFRQQISDSRKEMLFCRDGFPHKPWNSQQISRLVSDLLRKQSGISSLVFHDFRHTAFSNLHLVAEREWDIAGELSGYTTEQLETVFTAVFGNSNEQLRIYWALACFAGHNTPQTTFQSYLHFSSLITSRKLAKTTKTFSLSQCKALTDISSNKMARLVHNSDNTPDTISIVSLGPTLTSKIKKWISPCKQDIDKYYQTAVPDKPIKFNLALTHNTVYKVLSKYQDNYSIAELVFQFNIREEKIRQWICNAEYLVALKTREGKSRLISPARSVRKPVILPARLHSKIEILDVDKIMKSLRRNFSKNDKKTKSAVLYYLNNINQSSSGIHFSSNKDLRMFLDNLGEAIPLKRWLLVAKPHKPNKSDLSYWSVHPDINLQTSTTPASTNTTKTHSAYLYLKHPDDIRFIENNSRYSKYSATTLRYIMHMIGITTLKEENLHV